MPHTDIDETEIKGITPKHVRQFFGGIGTVCLFIVSCTWYLQNVIIDGRIDKEKVLNEIRDTNRTATEIRKDVNELMKWHNMIADRVFIKPDEIK